MNGSFSKFVSDLEDTWHLNEQPVKINVSLELSLTRDTEIQKPFLTLTLKVYSLKESKDKQERGPLFSVIVRKKRTNFCLLPQSDSDYTVVGVICTVQLESQQGLLAS
jgi:hypothetical protein